jgi:hypothetical protein
VTHLIAHCTCIEPWRFPIGRDTFCGTCGRTVRRRGHRAGLNVTPPTNEEWAAGHRQSVAEAVGSGKPSLTARACIATAIAFGNGFVLAAHVVYHVSRILRRKR